MSGKSFPECDVVLQCSKQAGEGLQHVDSEYGRLRRLSDFLVEKTSSGSWAQQLMQLRVRCF